MYWQSWLAISTEVVVSLHFFLSHAYDIKQMLVKEIPKPFNYPHPFRIAKPSNKSTTSKNTFLAPSVQKKTTTTHTNHQSQPGNTASHHHITVSPNSRRLRCHTSWNFVCIVIVVSLLKFSFKQNKNFILNWTYSWTEIVSRCRSDCMSKCEFSI